MYITFHRMEGMLKMLFFKMLILVLHLKMNIFVHQRMAGETGGGGDREGPSPPGPINFVSWVGPGGPSI